MTTQTSDIPEKAEVSHVHNTSTDAESDDPCHDTVFTPEEQRKIRRQIDRRLVIPIGIMYCVAFMDRTNMSVASIAGMTKDLELTGNKYNIANLVFFITYTLLQPPSTVLIRRIGPRLHLAAITLSWGAVMIGMGFVTNFGQLAALRTVLGFFEAGFFPGCVYLLSTWYTRYEVGKRYSIFYLLGAIAAAFSGILAYGIMQLKGHAGLNGWRWIFILEGVLTCVIGIAGYWFLVDFPDSKRSTWMFLGKAERQWVVNRIQQDRGDSQVSKFNLSKFLRSGSDWKVWAYAVIFFNTGTITYALAYTLPIILVDSMGFSVGAAQCLIAPPYAFAAIIMLSTAWAGDKYRLRGPVIIFNMLLCLIGLPIMGWASSAAVRYVGVFFVVAGTNSNIPGVMAFQANNIRGQWKRAFCSATLVGFGGIGGIAGSLVFRSQDKANGYKPGMWACIAFALLTVLLVLVCDLSFWRQNKLADQEAKILEALEDDATADFRYTY
ncbi:phthalate transporter [Pochonia chlamydosporia 170]|uniref:Phthalate transporter n=1 Tax=Pochonia chlamydosporia 170 TaxID=1380566 RepID=A0A219AP96_METCM|nr:phthalate transporter [Pochonia chlamydosporia 170]OWT42660.1 phthalate transporter [Pochonia chlamydosporia 170]